MWILDAKASQDEAIRWIQQAQADIEVLVFTYDREDVTEALIKTRPSGFTVSMGVDKKWTLDSRARD